MPEPKPGEIKGPLVMELHIALDAALPDCFWRRRFFLKWRDFGIDAALADWRTAPIRNPQYVRRVELAVEGIKQWPFESLTS